MTDPSQDTSRWQRILSVISRFAKTPIFGVLKEQANIIIPLIVVICSLFLTMYWVPLQNLGDGLSVYLPAAQLADGATLNFWGPFNDEYSSLFFTFTYHDIVIVEEGLIYPLQFVGSIFIYFAALQIGGLALFYLVSPISAALTTLGIYLLSLEVFSSIKKALIPTLILLFSPMFVIWGAVPGNSMISATSFVFAALFLIRYFKNQSVANLLGFSFAAAVMILVRYPNGFLFLGLLVVPLISFIRKRYSSIPLRFYQLLLLGLVPAIFVALPFVALNLLWFNDPFFIAYFIKNNVPGFDIVIPNGSAYYLTDLVNLSRLGDIAGYFAMYFWYSVWFVPFFAFSWIGLVLLFLKRKSEKDEEHDVARLLGAIFLCTFIPLALYYGAASGSFWAESITISSPHFRYLFPTTVLLPIFSVYALELIARNLPDLGYWRQFTKQSFSRPENRTLATAAIAVMILVPTVISYNYDHLNLIRDVDEHMMAFANSNPPIDEGSVILYGSRWPLLVLQPKINDYEWFFFIGIPEAYRENETMNTLSALLSNGESVFIFTSRYDTPAETAIIGLIAAEYTLEYHVDNYIERLDGYFARILPNGS